MVGDATRRLKTLAAALAIAAAAFAPAESPAAPRAAPQVRRPADAKTSAKSAARPLDIITRYRSARNPERRKRASTELIILHTTEAPAKSALRHLSERGECHYCVTEDGSIYQIVDTWRVAFHAGRSMWNGKEEVDEFSIGIECVGYHDKAMPQAQITAISRLVKQLQRIYGIKDDKVLTHSQVAYGAANKWQKRKHRGRKRCGMLFATAAGRKALGLSGRVKTDPDVKARRLAVGDPYLHKVLYGGEKVAVVKGVAQAAAKPAATAVAAAPKAPSKTPAAASGDFKRVPQSIQELNRDGYVVIGTIAKNSPAQAIAGSKWNAPDTYYTIRGRVLPGNIFNPAKAQEGTSVWRKRRTSR